MLCLLLFLWPHFLPFSPLLTHSATQGSILFLKPKAATLLFCHYLFCLEFSPTRYLLSLIPHFLEIFVHTFPSPGGQLPELATLSFNKSLSVFKHFLTFSCEQLLQAPSVLFLQLLSSLHQSAMHLCDSVCRSCWPQRMTWDGRCPTFTLPLTPPQGSSCQSQSVIIPNFRLPQHLHKLLKTPLLSGFHLLLQMFY